MSHVECSSKNLLVHDQNCRGLEKLEKRIKNRTKIGIQYNILIKKVRNEVPFPVPAIPSQFVPKA